MKGIKFLNLNDFYIWVAKQKDNYVLLTIKDGYIAVKLKEYLKNNN